MGHGTGKGRKVWNSSQESEFRSQKLTTKHPASLGSFRLRSGSYAGHGCGAQRERREMKKREQEIFLAKPAKVRRLRPAGAVTKGSR